MPSSARFKSCSRKPQGKQPIRQGLIFLRDRKPAATRQSQRTDARSRVSAGKAAPVNTPPAPRRYRKVLKHPRRQAQNREAFAEVCSGDLSPLEDPRGTPLRNPVTRTSEPPSGPPWPHDALALRRQAWPPALTAAFPLPESWDPARFLPPTLPGSCSSPT